MADEIQSIYPLFPVVLYNFFVLSYDILVYSARLIRHYGNIFVLFHYNKSNIFLSTRSTKEMGADYEKKPSFF